MPHGGAPGCWTHGATDPGRGPGSPPGRILQGLGGQAGLRLRVGMWGARVHWGCLRLPMDRQAFRERIHTSEERKDTSHRLGPMEPPAPTSSVRVIPAPAGGPGPPFPWGHGGGKGRVRTCLRLHSHWRGGGLRTCYLAQGSCSMHRYDNVTTINPIKHLNHFFKKLMAQSGAPSPPMSM